MQTATGKSVGNGIAIGKIFIYHAPKLLIDAAPAEHPDREWQRFELARMTVQRQQRELARYHLGKEGDDLGNIFEFHADMLGDSELIRSIQEIILKGHHKAEYAVRNGVGKIAQRFQNMDDPYFQARSADVLDIGKQVVEVLLGIRHSSMQMDEPYILVADDLTPSETVRLDRGRLLGIVTRGGSEMSHTAILARSMGIPALIQCGTIANDWDEQTAVLDGYGGNLYIQPTREVMDSFRMRQQEDEQDLLELENLIGKPNTTLDGTTIEVSANIGGLSDIPMVQRNDADGVGLFRSEFVYLESVKDPTEEEQFVQYKRALEELSPKQVIIRTCDIGADKVVDYWDLEPEQNPALGCRAVRLSLEHQEMFKRQLRALLRASVYGNLAIMFPMIISVDEVRRCKQLVEECRLELQEEGYPISDELRMGIMIETPAAALIADALAQEVDFFSIGTNDLAQYTLAIDRQNTVLEPYLDTHHPAILAEIRMTIEAAHRQGIRVGICGELGSDLELTETFLRMGVDELSVNPSSVLPLRRKIRSLCLK